MHRKNARTDVKTLLIITFLVCSSYEVIWTSEDQESAQETLKHVLYVKLLLMYYEKCYTKKLELN